MGEAARRYGSGLGADAARRLIARPIQRKAGVMPQPAAIERQVEPAGGTSAIPDLTRKLEAEIMVMKAVVAAERRENRSLRAFIGMDDQALGAEARAVRDRWAGLVDQLLHAAV